MLNSCSCISRCLQIFKCDEGKPTCAKCLKRGLECRYQDQVHIWFCDQTEEAAARGRRGDGESAQISVSME
ncbi:MAG: hypothetical protein CL912_28185 [Deltaproteobacteria bacterium]|nr:hypothetical protein [Deltaproteobacteria bacterium]